ncbi:MAG: hypothetical protein ABSD68_04150 [Candidatus Micrarchaeales archaeon]|jgi:hypothetical protein
MEITKNAMLLLILIPVTSLTIPMVAFPGASSSIALQSSIISNIWNYFWSNLFKSFASNFGTTETVQQQFAHRLSLLQSNSQNFTSLYLANAGHYRISLNQSWSIQVTDKNSTNSTTIGEFTLFFQSQSREITIQNGVLNSAPSPRFAVTITHKAFMSISQDVVNKDYPAAFVDSTSNIASGNIKYRQIS